MFRRMFAGAVIAALAAGVVAALLQQLVTTPLIIEAERYEQGEAVARAFRRSADFVMLVHDTGAHAGEGEEAWAPDDGLERTVFTTLATFVTAFGWALVLVALMTLRGEPLDARRGLIWGACGFAAAALAPSLGLPPELPGAMAAEVSARQLWWLLAVTATTAGIWLMAGRRAWLAVAGLALVALPHVVGAPHPERFGGTAPPELAAHFATASLVLAAIFWLVLGATAGAVLGRFDATAGERN